MKRQFRRTGPAIKAICIRMVAKGRRNWPINRRSTDPSISKSIKQSVEDYNERPPVDDHNPPITEASMKSIMDTIMETKALVPSADSVLTKDAAIIAFKDACHTDPDAVFSKLGIQGPAIPKAPQDKLDILNSHFCMITTTNYDTCMHFIKTAI